MLGAWAVMDLVVTDEQAERLAAGMAELRLVDLPEQVALVEFQSAVLVGDELAPGDGENLDLDRVILRELFHQVFQAPPGGLELLKFGVVEDGVDLPGDQFVDPGDLTTDLARELFPGQSSQIKGHERLDPRSPAEGWPRVAGCSAASSGAPARRRPGCFSPAGSAPIPRLFTSDRLR